MIEIPNSFDLMTNMHHTNPQLVEINQLTQRNAELRGSNKLMKFAFVGLLVIAVAAVYKLQEREKPRDPNWLFD
jgi:hypothetical protein